MIFSAEKWKKNNELKPFIKVSNKSLSFETMEASLRNAYNLFLVPLIGEAMSDELIEIYKYGPNPNVLENSRETATENERRDQKFLDLAQRAVGNLAFWYDFDELNVSISDSGFQRQDSDNFKGVYKYQENQLRDSFRNKGFNALDQILEFLEENVEHYPEFKLSPSYTLRKKSIVRCTQEVNETYYICSSRLIFLRLVPHFGVVAEIDLRHSIGDKAYEYLINEICGDSLTSKVEAFRRLAGRYITLLAIRRLILSSGSLTDRGLYFLSREPGSQSGGDEKSLPADMEAISSQASILEADARAVMARLTQFLKREFPDLYAGNPSKVFDRDNDGKRTFFA